MDHWSLLNEEWDLLASLLPEGWREEARARGAIRHDKGTTDPDALLRLLLLHVAGGLSLRSAVARAPELGLPRMSDVALLKRLRSSGEWLRVLARGLFETSRFRRAMPLKGRRLRAVDATRIVEPGKTGSEWRVHYGLDLGSLACDFYELTDVHGGETFRRFPIARGDVVLGDRGYGQRQGVAHVVRHGGDVVVRLNSTNFPLLTARGARFDLLAHLRRLRGRRCRAWAVAFEDAGVRYDARVCAVRKSRFAAEREKEKVRRASRKKHVETRPETLECAEYVVVLTTLSAAELSARDVLALYRARWQIELVFKRMKSLLRIGHLPKKSDDSARAWIHGKLLTALLVESVRDQARFFSPWGFELGAA
jgi:hypothetical protein